MSSSEKTQLKESLRMIFGLFIFIVILYILMLGFLLSMNFLDHKLNKFNQTNSNQTRLIIHSCGSKQVLFKSETEFYVINSYLNCNQTIMEVIKK